MLSRIRQSLFQPVDIASLVAFRILFGAVMIWEVCRYFQYGWIRDYYVEPSLFFTYYGFSWVRPWPGDWMYVHFAALGGLGLCIVIGLMYRLSAVLFFLGFTYVFLLDQSNYLNHFYFISLMSFLMILVPAHRQFSLDARLRPAIRSDVVPAWGLWLLRIQLGLVYFFAGVAKLNADYLQGEPMRMWLAERGDSVLLGLPIGRFFVTESATWFFSAGGLLFDLLIFPALLWRRTRIPAFVAAGLFHLLNAYLFRIGIFPWISLGATIVLFLPPDWPRRVLRIGEGPPVIHPSLSNVPRSKQGIVLGFVTIYLAIQVLVPLRHLLYPGTVHWTEEGHRFSWHMKLRDKEAKGAFWTVDPTGKVTRIKPGDYLSRRQRSKMMKTPDMILQFARHIAQKMQAESGQEVEVHADIQVSLNGRPFQPMIDPTVNLAAQERTLRHVKWILPLETPLRTSQADRTPRPDGESSGD